MNNLINNSKWKKRTSTTRDFHQREKPFISFFSIKTLNVRKINRTLVCKLVCREKVTYDL